MRRLSLALTTLIVSSSFAACERAREVYVPVPPTSAAGTFRIGTFASLTGSGAVDGLAEERGFRLAIETCNASGGVHGRKFELATYDDQSRKLAALQAAKRLATEDRARLIVGGSDLDWAKDAAVWAGTVPLVCAACGDERSAASGGDSKGTEDRSALGLAPSRSQRASLVAAHAVNVLGAKTFAILARAQVAEDAACAAALQSALRSLRVEVAEPIAIAPGTFAAALSKLANDAPNVLLVAFDGGDAAQLGLAVRRRSIPAALLYIGRPNLDVLPAADREAALEGACFPTRFDVAAKSGPAAEFREQFAARFGMQTTERALDGFAAARRVIEAIAHAKDDSPAELHAALRATSDPFPLFLMRVERGQFRRDVPPKN